MSLPTRTPPDLGGCLPLPMTASAAVQALFQGHVRFGAAAGSLTEQQAHGPTPSDERGHRQGEAGVENAYPGLVDRDHGQPPLDGFNNGPVSNADEEETESDEEATGDNGRQSDANVSLPALRKVW